MKTRKKGLTFDRTARALTARMWRDWVRPHWPRLVVAIMLMWLVAGTTSLYPLVIQKAMQWFAEKNKGALYFLPPLIIVVTLAKGLSVYFQTVATNSLLFKIVVEMQTALFSHLTHADLATLNRKSAGHYISHFASDINSIRESLSRAISNTMRDCLTIFGLVGTMFYMDWKLSLLVFLLYPVAIYPLTQLGRRLRKIAADTQIQAGDLLSFLNESIAGARMVKTYNLEEHEIERGKRTFERTRRLLLKAVRSRTLVDPTLEVLGGLSVAAVLAFTGYRIIYENVGIGNLTGFISALLLAAQPLRAIGSLGVVLQEGFGALDRVFNLMDEQPTIRDAPDAKPLAVTQGRITFRNVGFSYQGREGAALDNVSFDIAPGTTAALVGPSGGGKSTIINLIPRLYDVTQGAIEIDGQDLRHVTLKSLRDAIALVSQDVILFNDTVRANIALGRPGASNEDIEAAARHAAAHEFIMEMPQGYDTPVGEKGGSLSGGQRQRIAIARAMLKNAPILLLDEATSALDSESERQVQAALAELKKGRTTLVIAHRLSTVLDAECLFVMEGGHVVEAGTHGELLRNNGLYARLYRTQYAASERHGDTLSPLVADKA